MADKVLFAAAADVDAVEPFVDVDGRQAVKQPIGQYRLFPRHDDFPLRGQRFGAGGMQPGVGAGFFLVGQVEHLPQLSAGHDKTAAGREVAAEDRGLSLIHISEPTRPY